MADLQENQEILKQINQQVTIIKNDLEKVLQAFPAGDTDGHRRYHESVIEWRELRNKMVREAFINIAKVGALAGAGILIGVCWKALKISITQG